MAKQRFWVYAELGEEFGGPVVVRPLHGADPIRVTGTPGFVDYPLGDDKYESRLAVLASLDWWGNDPKAARVTFDDGQTAWVPFLTTCQYEPPRGVAA